MSSHNHLDQPNVRERHVHCYLPLNRAVAAPLASVGYLVNRSAKR
ncbi:hypothetical protein ACXR0O_25570 [Verrucomicrobiota bacterium sgz303538]